MIDCKVIKNFVGHSSVNLERGIFDGCEFILPEKLTNKIVGTYNGRMTIVNSVVRNSTFENWLGYYGGNSSNWTYNGIIIEGSLGGRELLAIDESWYNNTFKNCATMYRKWAIMTDFKFVGDNLMSDCSGGGKLYSWLYLDPFWNGYSGLYEKGDPETASKFIRCTFLKTSYGFHRNGANPKMIFKSCTFDDVSHPKNVSFLKNTYVLE
jgi:hypothetical protein